MPDAKRRQARALGAKSNITKDCAAHCCVYGILQQQAAWLGAEVSGDMSGL
jgi:hypothetical protein